jgi:tripartite-type tricarboxylate transporter receptor subunit TctC
VTAQATWSRRAAALLLSAALLVGLTTAAAAWPDRAVTIITPTGAGGGSDTVARIVAEQLARRWQHPVIVENHPGGDGIPAIVSFLAAQGEHTLLFATTSAVTVNPLLHEKLPYDPNELVPVSFIVDDFMAIVAAPTLTVQSLEELVALAAKAPGALNYATVPGAPALALRDWQKRQGIALVAVPYRNPIGSVTDLVAGRIDVGLMPLSVVLGQAKAHKLRLLAIAHARRAPAVPQTPTTGEAGDPAFTIAGGLGLFVPKQASSALRERIADDVQAVLADAEIRRRIEDLGYIARGTRPAEFAALLEQQAARWAAIARTHGLKLSQ